MIDYLGEVRTALDRIQRTQTDNILEAAQQCARSIGGGGEGLVHLFGTGHGSFPALETFPRSGSLVGFHPIAELPLTLLHHVFGDMGVAQYRFLHRQEGYGRAILESHRIEPQDTLILFSHSGINAVVLDMALAAHERGLCVVAVTSMAHSSSVASRHSSGKHLYEMADIVIDTGAPLGDACVRIAGLDEPVAPISSVLVMAVVNMLVAETARFLVEQGTPPHVEVNLNLPRETSARAHNDAGYAELWRRLRSR
jgi:uncharacterized phosphosugar-binding protein